MYKKLIIILTSGFLLSLSFSFSSPFCEEKIIHQITINQESNSFTPDSLTIKAGDTVKWENKDNSTERHTLSSIPGSGQSDIPEIPPTSLKPGEIFEHTFKKPGEYPYFCYIHRNMSGKVIVKK